MYKKSLLDNGLKVITAPMKGTRAVTVLILVGIGSRYESELEEQASDQAPKLFPKLLIEWEEN